MLIKYTGQSTIRLLDPYRFDRENGYTQAVNDADTALEMLSHPPGDFAIAPNEPLLVIVDADTAANLPLARIVSVEELAGLKASQVREVAGRIRREEKRLRDWVKAAQRYLKQKPQPEEPAPVLTEPELPTPEDAGQEDN